MPTSFRILLVDDDPLLIDLVSRVSQTSFPEAIFMQVTSTSQARTFFNSLEGYGPRLVLLDVNLEAQETGFDFLAYLRGTQQNNLLPVIMLTVSQAAADVRKAYEWGANSFCVKPFSYTGWQTYLNELRTYWLKTVTLPAALYTKK